MRRRSGQNGYEKAKPIETPRPLVVSAQPLVEWNKVSTDLCKC